jgi:hypothetical protein
MLCYVSACKLWSFSKLFEQSHDSCLLLHHQNDSCEFNVNFSNVCKIYVFHSANVSFCYSFHTSNVLTAGPHVLCHSFPGSMENFWGNLKMREKRNRDWLKYISLLVCHKDPGRLLRGSVGSVVALWRAFLCVTGSNKPRLTTAGKADSFCTTISPPPFLTESCERKFLQFSLY